MRRQRRINCKLSGVNARGFIRCPMLQIENHRAERCEDFRSELLSTANLADIAGNVVADGNTKNGIAVRAKLTT